MTEFKYEHLIGLPYSFGKRDCLEICRDFFRDNGIVDIPAYARPEDFWEKDLDLYMDHYAENGFELFDGPPRDYQVADVFLMAIKSRIASHAAIHLGDGRILHHYRDRLSEACEYKGIWRSSTVAVLRHKSMKDYRPTVRPLDFSLIRAGRVEGAGASSEVRG